MLKRTWLFAITKRRSTIHIGMPNRQVFSTGQTSPISLTLQRREQLLQLVAKRTYKLGESEALQRLLLDTMPIGVVIVDPVTRIIERVNQHVVFYLALQLILY